MAKQAWQAHYWALLTVLLAIYALINTYVSTHRPAAPALVVPVQQASHPADVELHPREVADPRASDPNSGAGAAFGNAAQPFKATRKWDRSDACNLREDEYRAQGVPEQKIKEYKNLINGRLTQKATWEEQSCSRWGLSGQWKPRDRRIYYGFSVNNEMDVLQVVLHEIFPVVDVVIVQEARHTWGAQFSDEKPLYFRHFAKEHFAQYASKIRYQEYNFSSIKECTPEFLGHTPAEASRACRWQQQWHARNNLEQGAHDIRDQDIFVVADLDELLSREFLNAMKHCDVHPPIEQEDAPCTKIIALTFGQKYNFECCAARPAGHFHPDITLGRCLNYIGPEEVRMWYGSDWLTPHKLEYMQKYRNQDVHCEKKADGRLDNCKLARTVSPKVVGPVGWHLMSFMSRWEILYKQFTRAGPQAPDIKDKFKGWTQQDLDGVTQKMTGCNERPDIFRMDAWGCSPLPHLVRENPERFRHFIETVPDGEWPDPYSMMRPGTPIREFLDTKKVVP